MTFLRLWRRSIGATQADVASKMGISLSYLSVLERGKRLPGAQLLDDWKDALLELEIEALRRREEARHG